MSDDNGSDSPGDGDIRVTNDSGLVFHMRPAVIWAVIAMTGGGNALYTYTRPEPIFSQQDKAKLLREISELHEQVFATESRLNASRNEMQKQVGTLNQICQLVRGDLEALMQTGPKGVIVRLDDIQRQLGKCTQ